MAALGEDRWYWWISGIEAGYVAVQLVRVRELLLGAYCESFTKGRAAFSLSYTGILDF